MSQVMLQVDAFSSLPFRGNPAAVVLLDAPRDEQWMQAIAEEMNLSETAFLQRGELEWSLRWFTPAAEVDLCGHATLASAHVLFSEGMVAAESEILFSTRSGILRARRVGSRIALDFPSEPAHPERHRPLEDLLTACDIRWIGRNRMDFLVELGSEEQVRAFAPDMGALARVDTRGLIVTARSNEAEIDFVSRFFAPAFGVDEDPVTGSAHCALAPYWGEKLQKQEMVGYQASSRGGQVGVRLEGERVILLGEAVTVMRAEILA